LGLFVKQLVGTPNSKGFENPYTNQTNPLQKMKTNQTMAQSEVDLCPFDKKKRIKMVELGMKGFR
jgi:hypothetical protein